MPIKYEFLTELFDILSDGTLFVNTSNGPFFDGDDDNAHGVSINCNDMFYWATADAEAITGDDLAGIEEAIKDARAAEASDPIGEGFSLYAARKRKMRPQRPWMKGRKPAIRALYEAAGPERDPKDEG
jgi:hypothetical protein